MSVGKGIAVGSMWVGVAIATAFSGPAAVLVGLTGFVCAVVGTLILMVFP